MKRYLTYPLLVCFAFFYVSCNQVIELDLPAPEDSIVVEGYIENGIPLCVAHAQHAFFWRSVFK